MNVNKPQKGFTLIELLIVIGIIAILAVIIIVAINPGRFFAEARDTTRMAHLSSLNKAFISYQIAHGALPAGIPATLTEICDTGRKTSTEVAAITPAACPGGLVNLSALVPDHISAIPRDHLGPIVAFAEPVFAADVTRGTGYKIAKGAMGIRLEAAQAELRVIAIGPAIDPDLVPVLPGYAFRRKLTIDHTKIDADLTDFPVLVKFTSANFDFTKSLANGYDIRFTAADGTTLLDFERERHDNIALKAEYWVRIPHISATVSTEFFIYYRTDPTADGANPTAVWDTNTIARWGLQENPAGTAPQMKDSTLNNNDGTTHGTMTFADSVEGKIGRALDFDGVDDYVVSPIFPVTIVDNFTMELLVSPVTTHQIDSESTSGTAGTGGQRYVIYPDHGVNWGAGHAGAGISVGINGISVYEHADHYMPPLLVWQGTLSGWNHITVVYINRQPRLYVNGVLKRIGLTSSKIVHPSRSLGGGHWGYFPGLIDEIRISNITHSPAWIRASFNSGNDTLLTYGVEEIL